MKVRIRPGRAEGSVCAPPSKSYAHRLLICAALSEDGCKVRGISKSEDMAATLDCVAALGRRYEKNGADVEILKGREKAQGLAQFPCRESGSTLRFFIPVALALCGGGRFTGTARLMERGIGIYEELFRQKGIEINKDAESIEIRGGLEAGEYTLRGDVSSQFISGLLFSLPLVEGESVIRVLPPVESRGYIDVTIDAMKRFGVEVCEKERNVFTVKGGQRYRAEAVSVEGDWSNAAALLAFNPLGGAVTVTGLNEESVQGDRICRQYLERLMSPGAELDLSGCPDLGPVLFAAAAANGGAHFTGTRRLRIKESDRAQAMADELNKFGVRVEVGENDVTVFPGKLKKPTQSLSAHNDHRIVMAMALLCSVTGGEIEGAEAVRKSYPDFFESLHKLGLETELWN